MKMIVFFIIVLTIKKLNCSCKIKKISFLFIITTRLLKILLKKNIANISILMSYITLVSINKIIYYIGSYVIIVIIMFHIIIMIIFYLK